ncbi:transmembrane protein 87A-like [Dendronephthya gigantea]|uniref:transmembrane protein 87A-like n=1 Tax=Dendronephthya gigantea TaxID=151771 RepID=UPI00106BE9C2|nr:transmembrane protein 87A-like [Dendronephthya gigantea]
MASNMSILLLYLSSCIHLLHGVPEPGVKEFTLDANNRFKSFAKSLFKDAKITLFGNIVPIPGAPTSITVKKISLKWQLFYSNCAQYFIHIGSNQLKTFPTEAIPGFPHIKYKNGTLELDSKTLNSTKFDLERKIWSKAAKEFVRPKTTTQKEKLSSEKERHKRGAPSGNGIPEKNKPRHKDRKKNPDKNEQTHPPKKTPRQVPGIDGNYFLIISVKEGVLDGVKLQVKVDMKMNTGYLSAAEWPLLPFYGAMSLVYLAYGVVWLIVSACQWRELLRIQFWIGGVIALGMLEKAIFFSEYNNVNNTGVPAHGLVVLALVLSCIKRTLSRILIIIVSMGFGIVKPRLGSALHRVLGVGCLYFVLSIVEGFYREHSVKADVNRKQMIASVPLSVLDAVICWWIFMSLLQTMRTLRIRKNLVKLSLYRHFTNILVVSVIASVAFMAWMIKAHNFNSCIKDWKEIWIDDAFWHFLFALILLAIMVLWRPTANNQRYAFTPLIDVGEDDDDDMTLSDAFQGMKMRGKSDGDAPSRAEKQRKKAEDDLKWVEENIPTSGGIDTALPSLLDSDEEMMTTKLEMSKME